MKSPSAMFVRLVVICAGVFLGALVRGAEWNSASADSAATSARVSNPIRVPAAILREFSMLRRRQMELDAKAREVEIAPEYLEVFNSVDAGDWGRTERVFQVCVRGVGWQPGSKHDPHFDKSLWEYAKEAVGAAQEFLSWPPEVLEIYAKGILDAIPPGAIYFGGTDAGRFVITAFQAVGPKPFFVLTQNALADGAYMNHLRSQYGQKRGPAWTQAVGGCVPAEALEMPSDAEITKIFGEYARQKGRPSQPGQRILVEGSETFEIGAMVANWIFERNKGQRPSFIEESYPMKWCFPYAEPCGPILRLNPEPLAGLSSEIVRKDRAFWDGLTAKLAANSGFLSCPAARGAFAKQRSAIANIYKFRRMWTEAEYAYRQGLELAPHYPELVFGLAETLASGHRFDEALALARDFQKKAPDKTRIQSLIDWIESLRRSSDSRPNR